MNTYYWKAKPNFGDLLGPLLLKKFSKIDAKWSEPEKAEIVVVGSILHLLPKGWQGIVAGCGIIKPEDKDKIDLSKAKILSVRGYLTMRALGLKTGDCALGDPGLLADELVGDQEKIYDLGIVPHWTDKKLEHDPRFTKFNPKIIRVNEDPLKVIAEIGQCKKIVSSSLHGIIVADAFGIPRRIELAPRMISHPHQEGGIFKWEDYHSAISMKMEIGVTQTPDKHIITEKQHELYDVFEQIKALHP